MNNVCMYAGVYVLCIVCIYVRVYVHNSWNDKHLLKKRKKEKEKSNTSLNSIIIII